MKPCERYNIEALLTIANRFDLVSSYLRHEFNDTNDLYSVIASIMYNKPIEDCKEFKNELPNPEGKELRNRAKLFVLPVIAECGGIFSECHLKDGEKE